MKYRLTFQCERPVSLPIQYNKILQASLLRWLGNKEYADFLHNQGYERNKRRFKNYTFSNIFGKNKYDSQNHKIVFYDQIQIYLSFYTDESHKYIFNNISEEKPLILGKSILKLMNCEMAVEEDRECIVDTLSPVTIHSTFKLSDGRKKTYYYEPWEKDFSKMIRENLIRKYSAINGVEPEDDNFEIQPVRESKLVCDTIYYNRFVIKGWTGRFKITGSPELIRTALLAGIGARNGIGMGCILQRNDM
jgi:CRISPR-associated endoribonuclease Cas6